MKILVVALSLLTSTWCWSQTPRETVQAQLEAYNAKDLAAFLEVFSDDAEAYNYGNPEPIAKGKSDFSKLYGNLFKSSPQLHSEVLSRQVIGKTVIDYEYITGRQGSDEPLLLVAIYVVTEGKIVRCDFIRE